MYPSHSRIVFCPMLYKSTSEKESLLLCLEMNIKFISNYC